MATVTPSIPNNNDTKGETIRKRTRATAEQLAVLEDMFAVNVSPNSKIRKQLADQLKMTDRSIQIWFQNRRAKVKHMQKRAQLQMHQANMRAQLFHYQQQHYYLQHQYAPHQRAHSLDSYNYLRSTTTPPFDINCTSSLKDLGLIEQQRQSVPPCLPYAEITDLNSASWALSVPPSSVNNTTVNPTHLTMDSTSLGLSISSLTIGRWHRLKMQPRDLECVYQPERQILCWNIVDGSHHFKMEIPVTSIQQLTYSSSPCESSPSSTMAGSELHLDLYHSPLFYMKHQQEWISCSDFTEHQQASQVLQHTLKGIGMTLWQELSMLMATYPETQHWIQLAPSPSFSNSSVSTASVSSLTSLAEEPTILKNDFQLQPQQMLLPPQTVEMTPTLSTSESSSTSSSFNVSNSTTSASLSSTSSTSTSSSLPVSKDEEPFMTLTQTPSAPDEFLIDPSLLDPSLWTSTGFMTS